MRTCIKCKKVNDGFICSHCTAKIATDFGKGVKKYSIIAASIGVSLFIKQVKKGSNKFK